MREKLIALILLASVFVAVVPSSTTATAKTASPVDVTLRVAPTYAEQVDPPTGYVIPSEHWGTKDIECLLTGGAVCLDPTTTTEAEWIVDPAEETQHNAQPGVAGCELTVSDDDGNGAVGGGEVLDQAVSVGCILGWDSIWFDGIGDYVVMVDDLWKSNATQHGALCSVSCSETGYPDGWWQIQVDANLVDAGINDLDLSDGQSLEFVYMRHG